MHASVAAALLAAELVDCLDELEMRDLVLTDPGVELFLDMTMTEVLYLFFYEQGLFQLTSSSNVEGGLPESVVLLSCPQPPSPCWSRHSDKLLSKMTT